MSCHHSSRWLLIFIAALMFIASDGRSESQIDLAADDEMGTLVTTEWLSQHLDDPDLVVLDCTVRMEPDEGGGFRSVSGRADYEGAHIPTAGFADLKGDLCDIDSHLEFAMPTPEQFCGAMAALGVGDDSRVVLYDGYNAVWAARVWWMLRWVGFDRAAVLDGGLGAWTAEERPLSTESAERQAKTLTPVVRPALVADRVEVLAAITDDSVSLIDAMHEPHFRGQMAMYDRPGHIPSAVNIPTVALLDESGHYRPQEELASICAGDRDARVITYCGAGVAASANAFVMSRLGFTDVAVYMASLQEWAADPETPLVVDTP